MRTRRSDGVGAGKYDAAMTFNEIAASLGITKQLAWCHYVNALKKLRRKGVTIGRLRGLAMELDRARFSKTL